MIYPRIFVNYPLLSIVLIRKCLKTFRKGTFGNLWAKHLREKSVTAPISLSPVNFLNEVLKFNNFLFPHQTEKNWEGLPKLSGYTLK